MQTFYLTDTGKVRDHNEDNVIILNNDNKVFENPEPMETIVKKHKTKTKVVNEVTTEVMKKKTTTKKKTSTKTVVKEKPEVATPKVTCGNLFGGLFD